MLSRTLFIARQRAIALALGVIGALTILQAREVKLFNTSLIFQGENYV